MSIFATNWIIDEETGEAKLVKHLNKCRIDRGRGNKTPGGWNKSGNRARLKKGCVSFYGGNLSKSWRKKIILEKLEINASVA